MMLILNIGMKKFSALIISFIMMFQGVVPLMALPTGAEVVSGTAQFQQSLNNLTVTNSANAIIEWQKFSIGQGEMTRFNQPNASSAVLNRVVGNDLSAIYGTLSSNGTVYLTNPNGILVGPTGVIDCAGFVASTLNISNPDFLNGNMCFVGSSKATITN